MINWEGFTAMGGDGYDYDEGLTVNPASLPADVYSGSFETELSGWRCPVTDDMINWERFTAMGGDGYDND